MDTAVKQRLLGGIVLVAGAAVLLPLMLDGSGAKLLSRLEPIPKPPVTTPIEQTRPQLNQQQQEAEDQVAGRIQKIHSFILFLNLILSKQHRPQKHPNS